MTKSSKQKELRGFQRQLEARNRQLNNDNAELDDILQRLEGALSVRVRSHEIYDYLRIREADPANPIQEGEIVQILDAVRGRRDRLLQHAADLQVSIDADEAYIAAEEAAIQAEEEADQREEEEDLKIFEEFVTLQQSTEEAMIRAQQVEDNFRAVVAETEVELVTVGEDLRQPSPPSSPTAKNATNRHGNLRN